MEKNKIISKQRFLIYAVIIVLILSLISFLIIKDNDNNQRNKLLGDAFIISSAINVDEIQKLAGNKNDLVKPFYQNLKKQLFNIRTSNDSYKFLYLLGMEKDKKTVFFFLDSQMPNSPDYVPPGAIYSEVPDEYVTVFKSKKKMTVGPVTDRWGTMITALIPITDKKSGEIIAILGLDIIDNKWNKTIYAQSLPKIGFIIVVILSIVILFLFKRKSIQEIEESENKLNSLFNAMTDLVMELDYDGKYITIAPTSPELMFKPPENIVGKSLKEVFPKAEADRFLEFIQSVINQNETLTIEYHLVINNKTYWFEGKATPKTKNTVLFIVRDITDRKIADEQIRKLSTAVTQSPASIAITDIKGNLEYVNPKFTEVTGYSLNEVKGINLKILKAGTLDDEFFKNLWDTISSGKKWRGEFHNKKKNGDLFWESASISPIFNSENKIINYVKVAEDITEKKRIDLELLKMEKLRSIGTLAGGIAHDFNNILAGIYGYVSLALFKMEEKHPSYHYLAETEKSINRATQLTRQLLTFSRGGSPVKKDVNLVKIIKETVIFDLSGSNVKPVFNFAKNLHKGKVDEGQIQQVFSNLTINANQASPDGGHLYISAINSYVSEKEILDLKSGEYLKITVQDEGTGIPKKYLDKIFDPYFTTKQTGSGLGLATTYSIIKKHNGHLEIDSVIGEGTKFTIYLPASKEKLIEQNPVMKTKDFKIHSSGGILIMDDEKVIRAMASKMINSLGYKTETASNGDEVISKYEESIKNKNPFDVIILDLTIPGGMGGKEAAKKILKINSEAKIIVSSGYTSGAVLSDYKAFGFIEKIDKPYTMASLNEVLLRVFNDELS